MRRFFEWIGGVLYSVFEVLLSFLSDLWAVIWGILCQLGSYILDFIEYLWQWVVYGVYLLIDWFLVQAVGFVGYVFDSVDITLLVNGLRGYQAVKAMIDVVGTFIPLQVMFSCAGIYFAYLAIYIVYRFIKSWTPFVSG